MVDRIKVGDEHVMKETHNGRATKWWAQSKSETLIKQVTDNERATKWCAQSKSETAPIKQVTQQQGGH